jgi:hypothetical protein
MHHIGEKILPFMFLGFILFGIWNIYDESQKGSLFDPKRRGIVAVRVILGGIVPLVIGLLSLLVLISDPFNIFPS